MSNVTRTIEYLIQATDDASKTFKKVGLGATAMGAAITASMVIFANQAREAAKEERQLDAVLKSTKHAAGLTKDELLAYAEALRKTSQFEDEAIIHAQSMLLTFTKVGKDVFPMATQAVADMASAMGTDLQGAAIQVGKALNDPIAGVSALARVGVQLSDAQKQNIELFMQQGKVMEAQKIILGELQTQFGGAAAAMVDPWIQLKNEFGELTEDIGKGILPVLNELALMILPVVQSLRTWMAEHPKLSQALVVTVSAVGALLSVLGPVIMFIAPLVSGFGSLIAAVGGVSAALAVLGTVLAVGGAVVVALGGLIFLAVEIYKHWEGLIWMFGQFKDKFIENSLAIVEIVSTRWNVFWQDMKNLWNGSIISLQLWWQEFVNGIKDAVMGPINAIKDAFGSMFSWISDKLSGFLSAAGSAVSAVGNLVTPARPKANRTSARAGGGSASGWTRVGEHGPELAFFPNNTRVVSADETRGMRGGGGLSLHITVQGSVIGLSPQQLVQMLGKQIMRELSPMVNHA